ncbi:hypothetical protein QJS04_geneDACA017302 [Acorus gramineus]|uniref:Uncharacterized protein n=1 Tax=Acorus gramineus TaxID=55184 RepID=A0AAV9BDR3_ACOGR|nr:hypothetical protein QJS04_geneDACA017302 [Acorus gramineus]
MKMNIHGCYVYLYGIFALVAIEFEADYLTWHPKIELVKTQHGDIYGFHMCSKCMYTL